jgi:hypothetical protein
MHSRRIRFIAAVVVVALLTLLASSLRAGEPAGPHISLEPHTIAPGEVAALRVSSDGQGEPPAPRPVPGLQIFPAGQSSSMSSVNGAVSVTRTLTYGVRAERTGNFSISIGGQTVQLEVRAGAPSQANSAAPSLATSNSRAFLRLVSSKRHAFVGEAVPVAIKAYFQPGTEVSLTGPPKVGSSAFTIDALGEPEQTREDIGGRTWAVVTWHTRLTPAVAGEQPTAVELPATMRWLEAREPADDPFRRLFGDDSPFDSVFSAPRQRDVTLRSSDAPLTVEALPTAGRPADFQGAVGHFDLNAHVDGSDARAHDPLKLAIEVRGSGDLDRVRSVGIQSSTDWKAYASTAQKSAAAAETRSFVQDIVPLRDGELSVPAVQLSYFDPTARRYVTKRTEPIPLRVSAAEASTQPVAAENDTSETLPHPSAAVGIDDTPTAHIRPLALRGWFLALNALPPLLFLGLLSFERLRRTRRSPAHEARRALRRERAAMNAARSAGDRAGWLAAARHALQLRLAQAWQMPADEVDAAAVAAHAPEAAELIALFRASERATYANAASPTLDLAALDAVVERHLTQELLS